MLSKQNQIFESLRESLGKSAIQNELLLEKFFYSITPPEMRVVRKQEPLKILFLLLLQAKEREEIFRKKKFLVSYENHAVYGVMALHDFTKKKKISDAIEKMKLTSGDLLTFYHHALDVSYMGYAYFADEEEKQKIFVSAIERLQG